MTDANELERRRLAIQAELDAGRPRALRNKLGQFATPPALALDMLAYARTLLPPGTPVRFLDPAFGTGSFYSALLQVIPPSQVTSAAGCEIDPYYGERASELWGSTGLALCIADFTRAAAPDSDETTANLLICNPPYVRHHHLPAEDKARLQDLTRSIAGVRLNGLAGLYCYYLGIAHAWLAEAGIAGWLVPSEFMDVNYGLGVKEYLLDRVTLLRIHRFDPSDVQFEDALVSSAVVWLRKAAPPEDHRVELTYGGTLAAPRASRTVAADVLRHTPKWTALSLADVQAPNGTPARARLSDLFTIRRGLVTGSNEFFIVTPEIIAEYQIPEQFLRPILPSARHLDTNEVAADEAGNPLLAQRLFLLSCSVPESEVRARYPRLWRYLEQGITAGVHQGYLCRHRMPWYRQEERRPAPFLCTYMGRGTRNGTPFRFILNHSRAIAANTYLMLYAKPALARYLRDNPDHVRQVWRALTKIAPQTLMGNGRVYGGGLHKIEPSELGNAPVDVIAEMLLEPRAEQMSLF